MSALGVLCCVGGIFGLVFLSMIMGVIRRATGGRVVQSYGSQGYNYGYQHKPSSFGWSGGGGGYKAPSSFGGGGYHKPSSFGGGSSHKPKSFGGPKWSGGGGKKSGGGAKSKW